MQCAYHPDREPVGACVACGRLICVECKALLGGKIYCTPCADKIFVNKQPDTAAKESVTTPAPSQKVQATSSPTPKTTRIETPKQSFESPVTTSTTTDSGRGSLSAFPPELKGWNWGAFFLSWIWGIGNKVWIAFIVLVLGLIWSIVLGLKGNEWAWQNKQWDSIEHFKTTQKKWKKWGIILFVVGIVIGLAAAILSIVLAMGGYKIRFG